MRGADCGESGSVSERSGDVRIRPDVIEGKTKYLVVSLTRGGRPPKATQNRAEPGYQALFMLAELEHSAPLRSFVRSLTHSLPNSGILCLILKVSQMNADCSI